MPVPPSPRRSAEASTAPTIDESAPVYPSAVATTSLPAKTQPPARGPTPPSNDDSPVPLTTVLPHPDLVVADVTPLQTAPRTPCPKCGVRVRYYCSSCLVPSGPAVPPRMPRLPFTLDVWKHKYELKGKSTALHGRVLAPDDVRVWDYPSETDAYDEEPGKVLVLYPSPQAQPIGEIDPTSFTHVIVVDGTWYQAHQMVRDAPFLRRPGVRHVSFANPPKTSFWRFQQKSEQHLATIEAMWWLLREYQLAHAPADLTAYDNMLWYYTFQYQRILGSYEADQQRKLNTRLKGAFRSDLDAARGRARSPTPGGQESGDGKGDGDVKRARLEEESAAQPAVDAQRESSSRS
ncbi:DTW domain-containing protein 1 [Allomyces javanicus]|nr:DTW domain-containing protein 1 [Allomyces javanicus]